MLTPELPDYLRLAKRGKAIPVYQDILADIETPVSAYWKVSHDQVYSFLLESVTGGEQVGRYSILGVRPRKIIRSKNGDLRVTDSNGMTASALESGEDPLHVLKRELDSVDPLPLPGMKHFLGGRGRDDGLRHRSVLRKAARHLHR